MTSFFEELKRRNVVKVGIAYAVTGWILVEVIDIVLPTFGSPDWVQKVATFMIILGLPIALIFAWAFELTPEGLKLERDVDRSQSITTRTGRKLDFGIIALLVVALSISLFLNLTGDDTQDAGTISIGSDKQAIAVLPFTSRSSDPDNIFFADGIHDDLLTTLANIASLKVISRTSVMEYRDTTKKMRQIGDELGVTNILEGAVQKSGNNVRINVQLIDTNTDEHLWAKSYDRELTTNNIFSIQSEISQAIAAALQTTLTPAEQARLSSVRTENLEAYNLNLAGRNNLYQRRLENLQQARKQFEQAVELDPNYAQAYAGLSESVILILTNHNAISTDEAFEVAEEALEKALALDSNDADIHASNGLYQMQMWESLNAEPARDAAEEAFKRAIEINPNHTQAWMWRANLFDDTDADKSIEYLERASELDPVARIPQLNLGVQYARMGRNDAALAQWLKTIDLHPDWPTPYANVGNHLSGMGKLDEALAWFNKAAELSTDPLDTVNAINLYFEFGEQDRVLSIISEIPSDHPMYFVAQAYTKRILRDYAGSTGIIEAVIAQMDRPPAFFTDFVADNAFLVGDYEKARRIYESSNPKIVKDDPEIEANSVSDALALAYSLQMLGDSERATILLENILQYLKKNHRLGLTGYGIRDAQVLALLARPEEALAALREGFDAGWRSSYRYGNWPLEEDLYLASVRDHPEFQVVVTELNAALAAMGDRVQQAEASNDWEALREEARVRLAGT